MNVQVPLKDSSKEYDPLYDVKGLPCWPSEPLYEQIEDDVAKKLQDHHINLESSWTDWSKYYSMPQKVLKVGEDFGPGGSAIFLSPDSKPCALPCVNSTLRLMTCAKTSVPSVRKPCKPGAPKQSVKWAIPCSRSVAKRRNVSAMLYKPTIPGRMSAIWRPWKAGLKTTNHKILAISVGFTHQTRHHQRLTRLILCHNGPTSKHK